MKTHQIYLILFILLPLFLPAQDIEHRGVTVKSNGKSYHVKRIIPDICKHIPINNNMLWTGNYASPKVPEPCKSTYVHTKGKLLPMHLDHDLETYGELEVLATLQEMQTDKNILLIDSRNEEWYEYRTIPGAINMPFRYFKYRDDYEFHFEYALKHLGVTKDKEGEYDFSKAKTLVLFCNGPWCSQSPSMIFALLEIGYPAEKLKWYRGGMQDWLGAGMTSTRD
ncbi:MAG: rhodanese-like domain-containing protein [Sulfurovum sp.]|nr:rhodanese-like domain-containing protein [Sulfurovum sp.]